MSNLDKDIWALDVIAEAWAEQGPEAGPPTREERERAATYTAFVTERIAALRREAIASRPRAELTERPVRPSILALARAAVLVRLDEINTLHPGLILGFAHHNHVGVEMGDDDLRSALEDAERAIESG